MTQKIVSITTVIFLFFVLAGSSRALVPIDVERKIITLPTSTPTPIKLIKTPVITIRPISTIKPTVTVTPTVTATVTPTVTPGVTVMVITATPAETASPTAQPTVKAEEVKPTSQESIPWYIMVTIGALVGIIVVQAWPRKTE